jgi:hypothetical protein
MDDERADKGRPALKMGGYNPFIKKNYTYFNTFLLFFNK